MQPKLALAYYIVTFLVVLFVAVSVVRHIFPIDEALDVATLLGILALCGLLLFAIYCAWRARNGR